jgi:hypothetical protein
MHPFRDMLNFVAGSMASRSDDKEDFIRLAGIYSNAYNWQREDTYWNILGRLPEESRFCGQYQSSIDRANHLWDCLSSNELRFRLIERLTSVFQDRKRYLFIHIPRTAGTSIREHIEQNSDVLTWNFSFEDQNNSAPFELWNHLALSYEDFLFKFLLQISDIRQGRIILTGHASLGDILNRNIIGPQDDCCAVIRDPLEIVKSLIKYHFKIARDHADRDDGRVWRERILSLDLNWNPDVDPPAYLVHKLIRSGIFKQECANVLTRSFSADEDVDQAMENIIISKCKIFHMDRCDDLSDFLNNEFGLSGSMSQKNSSARIYMKIEALDLRYIRDNLINKDQIIFDRILASRDLFKIVRQRPPEQISAG